MDESYWNNNSIPSTPTINDPDSAMNHVNPESISPKSMEIRLKYYPEETSFMRDRVVEFSLRSSTPTIWNRILIETW